LNEHLYPALVEVNPSPIAQWEHLPEEPSILRNLVNFYDQSHGADLYSWYLSEEMEEFSDEARASYLFPESEAQSTWTVCQAVSNEYGCTDTLCLPVTIDGEFVMWMPTAFTPDANGLNEVFKPTLVGATAQGYSFKVFDRWGSLIWETSELGRGWNGQGKEDTSFYVPDGTYVWEVSVRQKGSSQVITERGSVTIIR